MEHISEKVMKANMIVSHPFIIYNYHQTSPRIYSSCLRTKQLSSSMALKIINILKWLSGNVKDSSPPNARVRKNISDMVEVYKHLHRSTIPVKLVLWTRPNRKYDFKLNTSFANDGAKDVKSFCYLCVSTWNNLQRSIVNSQTVNIFQKRIEK